MKKPCSWNLYPQVLECSCKRLYGKLFADEVMVISVRHIQQLSDGNTSVLFYDAITFYFETDREDELRKTGFSKEGCHSNPQIIPGIHVSAGGYPLACSIHERNKYEGQRCFL